MKLKMEVFFRFMPLIGVDELFFFIYFLGNVSNQFWPEKLVSGGYTGCIHFRFCTLARDGR